MLISVCSFWLPASYQIQDCRTCNANYFYAYTFKYSVKIKIRLKRCLLPVMTPPKQSYLFPFAFFFQAKFLASVLFFSTNRRAICIHITCWKVCNLQSWRREAGKFEWLQHLPQIWYHWVDMFSHKWKRNTLIKMENRKWMFLGLA